MTFCMNNDELLILNGDFNAHIKTLRRAGPDVTLDVSQNDEFGIKYQKLCIKNEELCIKNEELCV